MPNFSIKSTIIAFTIALLSANQTAHATDFPAQISNTMDELELDYNDISLVITPLPSHKNNKLPPVATDTALENLYAKEPSDRTNEKIEQLLNTINTPALPPLTTFTHHKDTPRTPASTMKLIPTFVALDTLGKDFVWVTSAHYTGILAGDTLYGDLIIKGSGDPKLTHHKLKHLLYQVQQTGLKHIKGDIIIDSSIFQSVGKDPAEFDNEPLRPYNASPDGMLVNFSTITINSYPLTNGDNQLSYQLIYQPKLADINLPSSVGSRSDRCSSNISYSLAPIWRNQRLDYRKAMPDKCEERTFYLAYPKPKRFAQQVLKAQWLELGNTLDGDVRSGIASGYLNNLNLGDSNSGTPKLYKPSLSTHTINGISHPLTIADPYPIAMEISYPLSQQIYDINHHSNNVMTEQLTLSLGAYLQEKQDKNDKPSHYSNNYANNSNYPKSLAIIDKWWQNNLSQPSPKMTNGSGLCRNCTLTANNLSELLGKAYQHPNFDIYVDSLGIAGISGTIETHADRRPDSSAIGRAWIKTGTLGNVTAMAGYVKGKSGQEYSVVGIINLDENVRNANKYRPVLDSMLDYVAQH